jgi:23S rRNA pseudoU1915 N3-methylase RlmH
VKIQIRAVGKMRDRRMEELCREYLDRARRHVPVEVIEVERGEELLRNLPVGTEVVALEPGGHAWDTGGPDHLRGRKMTQGQRGLAFLIGGADGLPPAAVGQRPAPAVAVAADPAPPAGAGGAVRADLPGAVADPRRTL